MGKIMELKNWLRNNWFDEEVERLFVSPEKTFHHIEMEHFGLTEQQLRYQLFEKSAATVFTISYGEFLDILHAALVRLANSICYAEAVGDTNRQHAIIQLSKKVGYGFTRKDGEKTTANTFEVIWSVENGELRIITAYPKIDGTDDEYPDVYL